MSVMNLIMLQKINATLRKPSWIKIVKKCHSVFGIKELIQQEKPQFMISPITSADHEMAIDIVKKYFLSEHVLVQARKMDFSNDRALDEYLSNLLKQGNSILAKTDCGEVAGVCVGYASSPVDPRILRNYAFYRQDPNTKDFLYFTAKLQETPNLWDVYKQRKVYEIKMLTVLPDYRRQGLAVMMAEKSKEQAFDQGFKIIRMDCINPYDYKIAERCMLQCIVKFPLHKVRGANAPYIKRSSEYNRCVRVYVHLPETERDKTSLRERRIEMENLIE